MKTYIKYIVPTLLVINLLATGYFAYSARSANQATTQVVSVHDSVLLQIVCVAQIPGIVDLTQCPK